MVQADSLTSTPDESKLSTDKGQKMHQSHWTSKHNTQTWKPGWPTLKMVVVKGTALPAT